jgi:hypothetical protein
MTFQTISPGRHHEAALPDFGENQDPGGQQNHALDITAIREPLSALLVECRTWTGLFFVDRHRG